MSQQTVPDVIVGLIGYLSADANVTSLLGTTTLGVVPIWPEELDSSVDQSMVSKNVILRSAGGPRAPYTIRLTQERIHILSYGETPHLAKVVNDTVKLSLKALNPSVWAHTYIHYCNLATPGISMRDPRLQWPSVVSSWLVQASDVLV